MIIIWAGMTRLTRQLCWDPPQHSNYWWGQLQSTALAHLLFCPACCEAEADIGGVSPPSSQCHCGGVARGRSLTNTGCVRGWALRRSLTSTTISARVCRVILLVRGRVGLCHRDTGLPRHHTGASRLCPVRSLHNYSRSLSVTSCVATTTVPAFSCRPMRGLSGQPGTGGQAVQVENQGTRRHLLDQGGINHHQVQGGVRSSSGQVLSSHDTQSQTEDDRRVHNTFNLKMKIYIQTEEARSQKDCYKTQTKVFGFISMLNLSLSKENAVRMDSSI